MRISRRMTTTSTNLPLAIAAPSPRRFWRKVGRALASIPFADDLVAAHLCAMDRTTPAYVRAVLLGCGRLFRPARGHGAGHSRRPRLHRRRFGCRRGVGCRGPSSPARAPGRGAAAPGRAASLGLIRPGNGPGTSKLSRVDEALRAYEQRSLPRITAARSLTFAIILRLGVGQLRRRGGAGVTLLCPARLHRPRSGQPG